MAFFTIKPVRTTPLAPHSGYKVSRVPIESEFAIKKMAECRFNLDTKIHSLLQKHNRVNSRSSLACIP